MFPPKLIAPSVVRGAQQGQSHGGIYLIDFANRDAQQVVDWNTGEIDFTGRGWDRGLRGIAFHGGEVYVAASDELFVYDRHFRIVRSFRNRYLKHCHEISAYEGRLFLSSTGFDSLLLFDPQTQRFVWALHIAEGQEGWAGRVYDPHARRHAVGDHRPARERDHLRAAAVGGSRALQPGAVLEMGKRLICGNGDARSVPANPGACAAPRWRA